MIGKSLRFLQRLAIENLGWKLLSLAVAVVLWAMVASEPELGTLATVPLEYRNLPDELEISAEPVSQVVLELRGPSGELRGLGEGMIHPAVILDMSGMRPGIHTFPIVGNVKLPRGVRLVRANPSEARFEFDRRMTRLVPVRARVIGQGVNGYVLDRDSVQPADLRIEGPAGRVSRITEVVTDPVDVSSVVGSLDFRVNAFVEDPYVRFVSSPQVVVTVNMKKR
ncbi:MAG TPA: CdaR family protein [Bryobacteraceae bacterium]|nr:CdaR family protein [Bryobacteraceae bacterium]